MVRDILETAAMGTLRGILKVRYGMGLNVKFIQEVSPELGAGETSKMVGSDLHFPIQVGDKLLATAVLEQGGKLQLAERDTAGQLIRLFLEPELFSWYVQQMTNNLKASPLSEVRSNTVVPLMSPSLEDSSHSQIQLGSNFIFLETKQSLVLQRIAHIVHDISGRWAFLNLKDVLSNIQSPEDIKSLGSLTLVISDIAAISPSVQEMLLQCLSNSKQQEEPLFVIGSEISLELLEQQRLILPKLAQLLKTQRLEADRLPKDPQLLQESLEIMMEI